MLIAGRVPPYSKVRPVPRRNNLEKHAANTEGNSGREKRSTESLKVEMSSMCEFASFIVRPISSKGISNQNVVLAHAKTKDSEGKGVAVDAQGCADGSYCHCIISGKTTDTDLFAPYRTVYSVTCTYVSMRFSSARYKISAQSAKEFLCSSKDCGPSYKHSISKSEQSGPTLTSYRTILCVGFPYSQYTIAHYCVKYCECSPLETVTCVNRGVSIAAHLQTSAVDV